MQIPLQVTFRDMEPSAAVEAGIREKAGKLEWFYDQIMSCRGGYNEHWAAKYRSDI